MRLKSLSLENITSLKGKHFIDFDKIAEFSELFAITGPTGSGKSSILTAVSMALYGDHPKGLTASDLITTGEPKGEIHLTFSKGGDLYNVHWSCQVLKKNGEPRKSPLTNRVVNKNGIPTEESIESIMGLNFDQFSKVVILNQGQFSEFLNSTFTQRKDLLENILNQHDLKSLAPFLKRKVRDLETTIEQKEGQGELTMLMDPDVVKQVEQNLLDLKREINDLTKKLPPLKEAKKILKELRDLSSKNNEALKNQKRDQGLIEELLKELNQIKSQAKEHKNKISDFEKNFKTLRPKLERSKKLVDKKESLEKEKQKTKEQIQSTSLKRDELNEEKRTCEGTLKKIKAKLSELLEKLDTTSIKLEDLGVENFSAAFTNAKECLEKFNIQKQTLDHILEKRSSFEHEAQETKAQLKKIEKDFAHKFDKKAPEKLNQLITYLTNVEGRKDGDLSKGTLELKKSIESLQEALEIQKAEENEASTLKEASKDLEAQKEKILKEIADYKKKEDSLEKEKKEQANRIKEEQGRITLIEKNLKGLNYLGQALEIINEESLENCPVCDNSITKDKVLEITKHLELNNIETLKTDLKEAQERNLSYQKREVSLDGQITSIQENHKQRLSLLKDVSDGLTSKKDRLSEIEKNKSTQKYLSQNEITELHQYSLTIENLNNGLLKLRQNWAEENIRFKNGKALNETLQKELEGHIKTLKAAYPNITADNLKETYQSFQNLQKIINEKKVLQSNIEGQNHLLKKILKQLSDNESQKEALEKEVYHFEKELVAIENEFQIDELPLNPFEVESNLLEEEKLIKKKADHLSTLTLEKEVAYEKKNAQINLVKDQIETTRELIILYKGNLENLINTFENEVVIDQEDFTKGLQKTHLSELCEDDQVSSLTSFLDEVVIPLLGTYEENLKVDEKQSIILETQLSENQKQLEKLETIKEEIISLKKAKEIYEKLSPFLLKDAFRDFALEVLEEGLLQMANGEISSLAEGRYELVHGKAGKRRELLVKDKWQGHNLRKVSTLSGGETFLLSLGLALGLSEMTRGQTEVESFFIDEGFGTLDSESISQVLDCLMKMQSRGKQVGLISHVKALTDQIPVRLELEKNNFGESQIELR